MSAGQDRRGRTRFILLAMGFGGCVGIGFGYRLAEEIIWPLFWTTWLSGIAFAYFRYAFSGRRPPVIVQGWTTFWEAVFGLFVNALLHGSLVGAAIFAGLVFINGQFGLGAVQRVQGVVVAKGSSSSKGGTNYYLDVRDPGAGYTFRQTVPAIQHSLTRIDARWDISVRRGCFGWPFRVN